MHLKVHLVASDCTNGLSASAFESLRALHFVCSSGFSRRHARLCLAKPDYKNLSDRTCQIITGSYARGVETRPDLPPDDPLGLDRADREIRIERLKNQIEEVAGEAIAAGTGADCPPELEEAFLENILALETRGSVRPFDALVEAGVNLPPPEELDDAGLAAKLWELIGAMAERRLFLECTDHLSDRALYCWLWRDALREELMGFGLPFGNCHLDVLGSCSEEDIILQMRYYASESQRADFAADFPDFPMPARKKPPFDRDRHLPKPPPPPPEFS